MKRTLSVILAILILGTCPMYTAAAGMDFGVAPCWDNMDDVDVNLSFSGTKGQASVTVTRIYGVTTSLEATLTIYKKVGSSWVYVTSTSGSSTRQLSLEVDFTASSGVTYKAEAEVTAYGPNGSEEDTISETAVC